MKSGRGQNSGLWGTPFGNEIWQTITHLGQKLFFPAGTVVRHNQYRGIFYIQSGRVCLSYFSSTGKEVKALYYNKNTIFNEARTFSALNPACTFVCVEDSELYFFEKSIFKDVHFILSHPQVVQNLLSTMGEKILLHYYALTSLRADTDIIHLSKFILQLYHENGGRPHFRMAYSQQDIADILGVHRTTVARAIRKLREDGILGRMSRYEVAINNVARLKEIARDIPTDAAEAAG